METQRNLAERSEENPLSGAEPGERADSCDNRAIATDEHPISLTDGAHNVQKARFNNTERVFESKTDFVPLLNTEPLMNKSSPSLPSMATWLTTFWKAEKEMLAAGGDKTDKPISVEKEVDPSAVKAVSKTVDNPDCFNHRIRAAGAVTGGVLCVGGGVAAGWVASTSSISSSASTITTTTIETVANTVPSTAGATSSTLVSHGLFESFLTLVSGAMPFFGQECAGEYWIWMVESVIWLWWTSMRWLSVFAFLVFLVFLFIVAHLSWQLRARWKKLQEAARLEAEVIKKRRQGPIWDAQEILPGVWLGSFPAAINPSELHRRNITHILSIGAEFTPIYSDQFSYLVAFAMDCPGQNIYHYFEHTNSFIDQALANGTAVLVHCQAGVSRSASLIAAYLLAQQGISLTQALNSIKTIRPCIAPNVGFRKQLQSWEYTVNDRPNSAVVRGWAMESVVVDGCLAQYDQYSKRPQYLIGNRVKDHAMRLGFQALLTHGSLIARTSWGQRFLSKLLGQNIRL